MSSCPFPPFAPFPLQVFVSTPCSFFGISCSPYNLTPLYCSPFPLHLEPACTAPSARHDSFFAGGLRRPTSGPTGGQRRGAHPKPCPKRSRRRRLRWAWLSRKRRPRLTSLLPRCVRRVFSPDLSCRVDEVRGGGRRRVKWCKELLTATVVFTNQAAKAAPQGLQTDLPVESVLPSRTRPEDPRPDPMSMSFLTSASSNRSEPEEGRGTVLGGGLRLPMDFKSSILVGAGVVGGATVKREREWERGLMGDDGSSVRSFFGGRGGQMTFSSMLADGEHHRHPLGDFPTAKSSWGKGNSLLHKSTKGPKVCRGPCRCRASRPNGGRARGLLPCSDAPGLEKGRVGLSGRGWASSSAAGRFKARARRATRSPESPTRRVPALRARGCVRDGLAPRRL